MDQKSVGFLAGVAEANITPPLGSQLAGQFFRRVARKIHDPLLATALVLENDGQVAALVSLDVLCLPRAEVIIIRKGASQATGIPENAILIAATHTHTGPHTTEESLTGVEPNPIYMNRLRAQVVEALTKAWSNRKPAEVAYGKGYVTVATNRRVVFVDGSAVMYGKERMEEVIGLEGLADPEVGVLIIRGRKDSRILAPIVNYSCHATCVENADFVSADYPGALRRCIKEHFGAKTGVIFLNGAAGNTSPVNLLEPEKDYHSEEGMEKMGKLLGRIVKRVYDRSNIRGHFNSHVSLSFATAEIEAPLREISAQEAATAEGKLADLLEQHPDPASRDTKANREIYYASSAVKIFQQIQKQPSVKVEVQAFRIGQTAIVANPCEFFVEYGLQIKQSSPAALTVVSELSNGYVGYLPTSGAMRRGGYETQLAVTSRVSPVAGRQIVSVTERFLEELWVRNSQGNNRVLKEAIE